MPSCPRCGAVMDDDEVACPRCGQRLQEDSVYRANYDPKELLDLGLSPKFVEFVFLDPKPKQFRSWCEPRESGWPCYIPEEVSAVYPLWTENADVCAVWVREGQIEFVRLDHDNPEPVVLARSEQGLLLELFRYVRESEDWDDPAQSLNRLQQLAEVAGFRHMQELNEWHARHFSASDYQERWRQFVASVDKRSAEPPYGLSDLNKNKAVGPGID